MPNKIELVPWLCLNFSSHSLGAATDRSKLWVLFTPYPWPTVSSFPGTWNICASFFTCSVFLVDKVFRAVMWLDILTFLLRPPISVPDIRHISFYFNVVYLPKSGNDLKLDPEMNRSWYSVFLYYEVRLLTFQLLLCWDFCNVLACEKIFYFIYLALWLSYFFSMVINTFYPNSESTKGLPYIDWRKIKAKNYQNTSDSQHLTQIITNKSSLNSLNAGGNLLKMKKFLSNISEHFKNMQFNSRMLWNNESTEDIYVTTWSLILSSSKATILAK